VGRLEGLLAVQSGGFGGWGVLLWWGGGGGGGGGGGEAGEAAGDQC